MYTKTIVTFIFTFLAPSLDCPLSSPYFLPSIVFIDSAYVSSSSLDSPSSSQEAEKLGFITFCTWSATVISKSSNYFEKYSTSLQMRTLICQMQSLLVSKTLYQTQMISELSQELSFLVSKSCIKLKRFFKLSKAHSAILILYLPHIHPHSPHHQPHQLLDHNPSQQT